jgi:hypothetical protein
MIAQVSQGIARMHSKQLLALFGGQPVTYTYTQTLRSFDPANASGEVGAQQPAIAGFTGKSANRCEPEIEH